LAIANSHKEKSRLTSAKTWRVRIQLLITCEGIEPFKLLTVAQVVCATKISPSTFKSKIEFENRKLHKKWYPFGITTSLTLKLSKVCKQMHTKGIAVN
jgi:hypothetical protein